MSLILAGLSALLYGCADFAGGWASRKSKVLSVLVVSQTFGALMAVVALLVFWPGLPAPADILWGFAAGLCGAFGLFMLYRGIAASIVAIVSPTAALAGAVLPLAFGMFAGERPTPVALVGAAICVPAILLLSWSSGAAGNGGKAVRSALIQGLVAGVGFAGFFIAVSRTNPASGLWPLAASRGASITVAAIVSLSLKQRISVQSGCRSAAIAAGLADMGANICFLLASRTGMLALVAIIVALYPAPTVLLARAFYREKISLARSVGLALAIAGAALIGLR